MAKKPSISFRSPGVVPPGVLFTNTAENNGGSSQATGKKSEKMASSSKYRHVEAVHSTLRTSCLSHVSKKRENARDHDITVSANETQREDLHPTDTSKNSPSFLGFRNLIVLVVGKLCFIIEWKASWISSYSILCLVVMNLRLVVENFMKVGRRETPLHPIYSKFGLSTDF